MKYLNENQKDQNDIIVREPYFHTTIYGDNMLLDQDNYMRKIDADYQVLR